jgi:hypothetical protein
MDQYKMSKIPLFYGERIPQNILIRLENSEMQSCLPVVAGGSREGRG